MDEPLSALDKQLRDHMQIELRILHDRLGMTTVCVTHDQREALTMSDRVAVIDQGRIMPARLAADRSTSALPTGSSREFIGESAFLPVEHRRRHVFFAGQKLKLPRSSRPRERLRC